MAQYLELFSLNVEFLMNHLFSYYIGNGKEIVFDSQESDSCLVWHFRLQIVHRNIVRIAVVIDRAGEYRSRFIRCVFAGSIQFLTTCVSDRQSAWLTLQQDTWLIRKWWNRQTRVKPQYSLTSPANLNTIRSVLLHLLEGSD